MVTDLRALNTLTAEDLHTVGGGYTSAHIYMVRKSEDPKLMVIAAELTPLQAPYVKRWERPDDEQMKHYLEYARQGYSMGAYVGETLVGLALCEARTWNRSLWIWEFHVAPGCRRQGIGRALMEAVVQQAHVAGFRIVGVETQSTNVPAIAFYRAVGFELDGLDLSLYSNTDAEDGEVAFFMKRKLRG